MEVFWCPGYSLQKEINIIIYMHHRGETSRPKMRCSPGSITWWCRDLQGSLYAGWPWGCSSRSWGYVGRCNLIYFSWLWGMFVIDPGNKLSWVIHTYIYIYVQMYTFMYVIILWIPPVSPGRAACCSHVFGQESRYAASWAMGCSPELVQAMFEFRVDVP